MAIRIRYQYCTSANLVFSIERLYDGLFLDFVDSVFRANPQTLFATLSEDAAPFKGRYHALLSNTRSDQFSDGNYAVNIHDSDSAKLIVAILGLSVIAGDDDTNNYQDPWSQVLPGNYAPGTAGLLLAQNLDAKVSSRSTFTGGAVASVTNPVTVGVNNDKSGYALSSSGLDAIGIESGVNLRQAMSPILAAAAGVVSGAGTGTISIRGGNSVVSRIVASTDNAGNRLSVSLNLPT